MKNKKIKGSITVFMTFIFLIIFGLILALYENTRIISSAGYMKNAAFYAEKSLFGDYNKELFSEYGLFGYGGYNGLISEDMRQEFNDILNKNIAVKPEEAKLSYTDVYKIGQLNTYMKKYEGFADGDNLYLQIRDCIMDSAVENMTEKMKNKYSDGEQYDKKSVFEKLDEGGSYETGEYKEKYEENNNGNSKNNTENKKTDLSSMGEKKAGGVKNNSEEGNSCSKESDKSEDVGNPLEFFKEVVQDGYLSLVCDSVGLSEEEIEKATISGDGEDTDNYNQFKEKDYEKSEGISQDKYESAGSYLKKMLLNAEEPSEDIFQNEIEKGSRTTYKMESIIYASKMLSSYTDSGNRAVDYGMEYLICGNKKEKDNMAGIVNRLIAARMFTNFIAISTDKTMNAKAFATATAIAGATGIEPVIKGVQYVILAILAFEESCIDTAALLDNKQIPFVKKITDIKIKYEEICNVSGDFFQHKAKLYSESDNKVTSSYVDYSEYLFGFAMAIPQEKIKVRLFDVIQCDLRKRYNESFQIYDCIVAADFNVTYKMKFIFPFLWNTYGKNLKYKIFRKQVSVSYRYE